MSPAEAQARLVAGNQRFQDDKTTHPVLHSRRREELVGGQSPFAVILSCSDSRVCPELIFDEGLGGLFVVRIAGNNCHPRWTGECRLCGREPRHKPDRSSRARQLWRG